MFQSSEKSVRKESNLSECKICGAPACHAYYGVISCDTCKVFFKRNAENIKKLMECRFDGRCEINIDNRHTCASCRLSKCFRVGMKIERIRRSTRFRQSKSNLNKPYHSIKFPTINLLDKDNSTLNENQWILLSNLIHNYDEKQSLIMSNKLKSENGSATMITEDLIRDLMKSFYENAGTCLRSNNDISHLSIDDRSVLLHTAAENVTCISGLFILSHSHLINDQILWNYIENVYGKIAMQHHRWSTKFTQLDPILFKLSMNLFTFSANNRVLYQNIPFQYENLNEILKIENSYVELTWKYLIYKYGYYQSIQIFINIIQWFLAITVCISSVHQSPRHVDDIELLIRQTETSLAIDDIDKIIENN